MKSFFQAKSQCMSRFLFKTWCQTGQTRNTAIIAILLIFLLFTPFPILFLLPCHLNLAQFQCRFYFIYFIRGVFTRIYLVLEWHQKWCHVIRDHFHELDNFPMSYPSLNVTIKYSFANSVEFPLVMMSSHIDLDQICYHSEREKTFFAKE